MATLIRTDGSAVEVAPANGRYFTLGELQNAVGGYIEGIRLPSGDWLYTNEDGKGLGLPKNERATLLGYAAGIMWDDYVVGTVVIVPLAETQKDDED